MPNQRILCFRPWIWGRTTLYEYFCMSWATRIAAESTDHAPLAARLVGESFELAFKALSILARGPGQDLTFGHRLSTILRDVPLLEPLLRNLWGSDLDHVVDLMDGECNPSQIRYGAGAGRSTKGDKLIPSGYAETPVVWTSTTLTLYEELMSSLGHAIWSNYPAGDRHGEPVNRCIELSPAVGTPTNPRRMTAAEEAALQKKPSLDPTVWAFLLLTVEEQVGEEPAPYWGIIPTDRLNDPPGTTFYVRARVSATMFADVEVTKSAVGFTVGGARIAGRCDGTYRLAIHKALAVLPSRQAAHEQVSERTIR